MHGMFSTKGRYALRVMADLATHDGWVSLGDVSKRQGISRKYLEQVTTILVKGDLVESQRGKGGGYKLNRDPHDYTLGEILRVAEGGSLAPVNCLDCKKGTVCSHIKTCTTLPIWRELGMITSQFLDSKHLSDLIVSKNPEADIKALASI